MFRLMIASVLVALIATPCFAQDSLLLTDNGLTNPEHSEYADAPMHETGGHYEVNPPLAKAEDGVTRYSFAEGAFTNGDSSFDWRREPSPYTYWQGQPQGELLIDLGAVYNIDRVRLCVLNKDDGPHGTDLIDVSVKGDPLEFPDVLRVGKITDVQNGWNELQVDRRADGLRIVFSLAPDNSYITLSEVEVWGTPVEGAEAQAVTQASADHPKRVDGGFTWWAFDFGPPDSPSFARFATVHSKTVYSREQGFGWIPYEGGEPITESNFGPASDEIPGLGERDRGGAVSDPLYRDLLMTLGYYHSQVRQTFAVDLPAGTYRVVTYHGDIQYGTPGKQNYFLKAEGEVVADEIILPVQRVTQVQFDVTVEDGRLDLTLDSDVEDQAKQGFSINGMVILPAGTEDDRRFADRKIEQITAALQRFKAEAFERDFTELDYPDYGEMVEPTADDRERGFIGWAPNWMELIYRNAVPTAETANRDLAATAAPGEFEPATVAVRALEDLANVRVEVGDLTAGAATIPASAVDVRSVRIMRQRIGSSWGTEWRSVPEILDQFDSVDVDAETAHQFWLTVRVPEDAEPGSYTAPVRAIADSGSWETELKLTVLPFELQPAERPVGMYWRDTRVEGERLDMQIRDMLEHGVTAVTCNSYPVIENVDGELQVDSSELLALMRHIHELGITGPIPFNPGLEGRIQRAFPEADEARFEELYVQGIRELEKVSARDDTPKLLYYPVDEIGNHEDRGRKANRLCGLIGQVEGATSYITVNNYEAGEKWGDTFDIWCGNIPYTLEQEQRLLERGKRYMRYGPAYLNDCREARNSSGFGFYRRPAEAMYYWHYQAYNGDPFYDFDGTARDWCAAYPGEDGPIPTLDWESIREGIDDMRYMATLKALAERAEEGTAAQQAAAQQALAELEAVLTLDETIAPTRYAEDLSHEEYANLRTRLIEQILTLREALGE